MSLERLTQITTVGIVSGITLREPDASGTTNLGNVTAGVLTATNFINVQYAHLAFLYIYIT